MASLVSAMQTQQLNAELNPDLMDQLDDIDEAEIADELNAAVGDLAEAGEELSNAASGVSGPFKIIVTQFQIFSAVTIAMPIDWPSGLTGLSMSFSFVRLDFVSIFGIGCMTEVNPVMFGVFGLTAILIVLAMVATLLFNVFSQTMKDSKDFFYKWEQAISFLAYPEVRPLCCCFVLMHPTTGSNGITEHIPLCRYLRDLVQKFRPIENLL